MAGAVWLVSIRGVGREERSGHFDKHVRCGRCVSECDAIRRPRRTRHRARASAEAKRVSICEYVETFVRGTTRGTIERAKRGAVWCGAAHGARRGDRYGAGPADRLHRHPLGRPRAAPRRATRGCAPVAPVCVLSAWHSLGIPLCDLSMSGVVLFDLGTCIVSGVRGLSVFHTLLR